MSHPDESHPHQPTYEQPDGVASYGEEQTIPLNDPGQHGASWAEASAYRGPSSQENTLPLVDLYPPSEHYGAAPPYPANDRYWDPSTGAAQQTSGEYRPVGQQDLARVQQQPYGYYGQYAPAEHPQSTTVLVLSLVGFAVPVLFFIAWYMGGKAKNEIGQGAPFLYAGSLKTGHIIGKVMGIITIVGASLYALVLIAYAIFMVSLFASI